MRRDDLVRARPKKEGAWKTIWKKVGMIGSMGAAKLEHVEEQLQFFSYQS